MRSMQCAVKTSWALRGPYEKEFKTFNYENEFKTFNFGNEPFSF